MSANAVGFREHKTHATATLVPVEGCHIVVGGAKVAVPKGKGFVDGFVRAINDANLPFTATAKGESVALRARTAGEAGNVTFTASWVMPDVALSGGRTSWLTFTVDVTDTGAKVTDLADYNTTTEAIAAVKSEFVSIAARVGRPIAPAPTHPFRSVGGEPVCADCGRSKDKH